MDWLQRLSTAGFSRVGEWRLERGALKCQLDTGGASTDVLYCFVSGAQVLYLGKTTMALSRRMYGYQNPGPTQRTNIRNHALLVDTLASGRSVEILTLECDGDILYHGFRVSIAAGLEDDLIRQISPPWNKSGAH